MFQHEIIHQIQKLHPDIEINKTFQYKPLNQKLFLYKPNPIISISDIRFITDFTTQPSSPQINSVLNNLQIYMNNLISILQHNQTYRLSWTETVVRGRVQQTSKISLKQYYNQKTLLNSLISQCRYGVTCKSQFLHLLDRRRKPIFTWFDDSHIIKNIQQICLPEMPQNYQYVEQLTQDTYFSIYQTFTQKIYSYQFNLQQYLSGQLPYRHLQQICREIVKQDSIIFNNNKLNQLIRYAWEFCANKYYELTKLRNTIFRRRYSLINSIIKTYYICFYAKRHIAQIQQSLDSLQLDVLAKDSPRKNTSNSMNLGRNSISHSNNLVSRIVQIQNLFSNVLSDLTDVRQCIFVNLYERKLKKRVQTLFKIDNRLTHIYKIQFNPDYAQCQLDLRNTQLNRNVREVQQIQKKFKQLEDLFQQSQPLNQSKFRLVFQQLQNFLVLVQKVGLSKDWSDRSLNFQNQLIRNFVLDKNGIRKYKKEGNVERFQRSRVTNSSNKKSRSINIYEVKKQEIFEETYEDFHNKNISSTRSMQNQPIDIDKTYEEANTYLLQIKQQFGQQLLDLVNFKVYLLPRLIQKIQSALSKTDSSHVLYPKLTGVLQNLKLLSTIIRPEINMKKFDMIFFPRVNASLLTMLKQKLLQHQRNLKDRYSELSSNATPNKTILFNIQQFIQVRLKFLYFLLEDLETLQKLALSLAQINLNRDSYDIGSDPTYNTVLKLLLAQKQIRAHQKALPDKIQMKNSHISQKALKLLCDCIYPNFINSLSLIFQNQQKTTSPNTLQMLLQLSQEGKQFMEQTNQYLDTIIKIVTDSVYKDNRNTQQFLKEFSISLRAFYIKAEQLINRSYKFINVNAELIKRQRVRIQQFINICQGGPSTNFDIIDDRSKKFLNLLRMIKA